MSDIQVRDIRTRIYSSPSLLPVVTAINNDQPNHGIPYPSITWFTEVTEQSFIALIKKYFALLQWLQRNNRDSTRYHSNKLGLGQAPTSQSPVSQSGCQDLRYEGPAIVTKTQGIGLSIIREVDDDK